MHLFSAPPPVDPQSWPAQIPPDSFYARPAPVRDVRVTESPCRSLSRDSAKERPGIPPLPVVPAIQPYHDHCSDRETRARAPFDAWWEHGPNFQVEDTGFEATRAFRRARLRAGLDRVLVQRPVTAALLQWLTLHAIRPRSSFLGIVRVREKGNRTQ